MSAGDVVITSELARRLGALLVELGVSLEARAFAELARRHGVGLVDIDRHRSLIDMSVYSGALYRGRRWRAIAEARRCPRCEGEAETVERRLP
ncbi:MAG: hypothetical protein U1E23_14925 [Reyranellaceae bacterium]